MSRSPVHQPPAGADVAALVAAGISWSTAMAMEAWKAREVLDLLRGSAHPEARMEPARRGRGTI
ncbi:MAG: hypothetical protein ACYDAC_09490 [Candidatus Dormibacteria bacterium]